MRSWHGGYTEGLRRQALIVLLPHGILLPRPLARSWGDVAAFGKQRWVEWDSWDRPVLASGGFLSQFSLDRGSWEHPASQTQVSRSF